MIDCTRSTTSVGKSVGVSSGDEDLWRIARYLGLAVTGQVITFEEAADALVEWTEADSCALNAAAARSEAGSVAERLLNVAAAAHPRAA